MPALSTYREPPLDLLDTPALGAEGYLFLPAPQFKPFLETCGGSADWNSFATSWQRLPLDLHMADGGRYRRRRHAVFRLAATGLLTRQLHRPHFQHLAYNRLNGGIARWFSPMEPDIAMGQTFRSLVAAGQRVITAHLGVCCAWELEAHQFRIEASPAREAQAARPTPEGIHRDGVDFAMVVLIRREGVASGVTALYRPDRSRIGHFTLERPGDFLLLDDQQVLHGVTPITALGQGHAYRDVLVVTFRRAPEPSAGHS